MSKVQEVQDGNEYQVIGSVPGDLLDVINEKLAIHSIFEVSSVKDKGSGNYIITCNHISSFTIDAISEETDYSVSMIFPTDCNYLSVWVE